MATNNTINKRSDGLIIGPTGTGGGNTGELRFSELAANGSNYVAFKSPDSLTGNTTYTWPSADGTSGQVLSTNGSGSLSWAAGGGGGTASVNNVVINPAMLFSQRGSTFSTTAGGFLKTLDRWATGKNGTMVYSIAPSTDVPTAGAASYLFQRSMLATVTTAQASLTGANGFSINQMIEGYNWALVAQQTTTLSFWVKSSITGTYCVALINSGLDRSYVAEYTVNAANTWERKTITITASPSAGTWDYTTGIGAYLYFALGSGTTAQTTPNAWQTGNFYTTSNQVNHTGTLGATFYLTGVKLEAGSTATPYVDRLFSEELQLCQRYFEKSYNLNVNPGTATIVGRLYFGYALNTNFFYGQAGIDYVPKRVSPTVVIYNDFDGSVGYRNLTNNAATGFSFEAGLRSCFVFSLGALTANTQYSGQFTIDAEF